MSALCFSFTGDEKVEFFVYNNNNTAPLCCQFFHYYRLNYFNFAIFQNNLIYLCMLQHFALNSDVETSTCISCLHLCLRLDQKLFKRLVDKCFENVLCSNPQNV